MGRLEIAAVAVAVLAVLLAVHIFIIPLNELLLSLISEKNVCDPGDLECLNKVQSMRANCTPPTESIVTIPHGEGSITIKIVTYMDGDRCVTKEIVLDDSSGIAPYNLTGYEVECDVSPELLEEFGQKACNGSLMSFLGSSEEDSETDTTTGDDGEVVYTAYCTLEADECKEEASSHIKSCDTSEITLDQELNHTLDGTTYWTLYIEVEELPVEYTPTKKLQPRCVIYHELINAVNLPPELPPHIIGMNMTCTIDANLFPINSISVSWCEGDLVEYIQIIYP